jgi:hypothetical protein
VENPSPSVGIWYKVGAEVGVNSVGAKWKNGIILVFVLNSNSAGNAAMSDLYGALTASFSSLRWPTNDLFPATLSYQAWRSKYFSAEDLVDESVGGDKADPDGDGVTNLLEYAQDSDPRMPNNPSMMTASIQTQDGVRSLVLSFPRLFLGCEVDYSLDASSDLRMWSPVFGEANDPFLNADGTTITASVHAGALADFPARFFRLRVSRK